MLISDDYRFVFVHVRKTGGSSLRRVLAPLALSTPDSRRARLLSRAGLVRDYRRKVFRAHAPLVDAQRSMPPERFWGYFKFAFVRNPWDRLVSEYEFIRGFPGHARHRKVMAMDFPAFVRYQAGRTDAYQFPMLVDRSGALGMDFVGRFERLQADFDEVCRRLRLTPERLPHANRGSRRDPAAYYDAATREFVARTWSRTIENFGYSGPGQGPE